MKDILTFLEEEGISEKLLEELRSFRSFYKLEEEDEKRLPKMEYWYYGKEIWEAAIAALLSGANLLLDGPKATGKTGSGIFPSGMGYFPLCQFRRLLPGG